MGLTGPVPTRVDATVKAGLLELVSESVEQGWSTRRACSILEVDDLRLARWMIRREDDQLDDLPPGGNPVHALMPSEVKAILELVDEWSEIDRSHRKLAHRGSRLSRVFVSASTFLRVLVAQGIALPSTRKRDPVAKKPWPDWVQYRPNQVWGWDATHFVRANRVALAIIDLVSRKWIATLVTAEQTSTQVEVVFNRALDAEGLIDEIERRAVASVEEEPMLPILLAVSDNGPQMTSGSTGEYMALCSIVQHFRPPRCSDRPGAHRIFLRTPQR